MHGVAAVIIVSDLCCMALPQVLSVAIVKHLED